MAGNLGIINRNGIETFSLGLYNAQLRKQATKEMQSFKDKINEEKFNQEKTKPKSLQEMIRIAELNSKSKPSGQLTREGLLKIMIEKAKPASLEKQDEADSANMMVAIANLDSSNQFTEAIKEMMRTNQLLSAMSLDGKEIEAYRQLTPEEALHYQCYPDQRPTIRGIVTDSSHVGDKLFLHLDLNPGAPKGLEKIAKIEFKDMKRIIRDSTLENHKRLQGLSGVKQMKDLLNLKGQTIKAYLPLVMSKELQEVKEYIDLRDRETVEGKVIDIIKENHIAYLQIKTEKDIVKVVPSDLIEILNFNKENPIREFLLQNQWIEALKLKGKTVEAFDSFNNKITDPQNKPTIIGEVSNVLKEKTNIYLNLKQGDNVIKINFNDIIKV